jgi:predicted metal-dependent hydrolase
MGLDEGLRLLRAGAYFDAHEQLEAEWRLAPSDERDFLQGLVHVTVAWYQAGRENRPGCERQLEKAQRRLASYGDAHRGVDLVAIREQLSAARALVAGGSLDLPPVRV